MSKGTPVITLRCAPLFRVLIEKAIKSANKRRRGAPYTLTTWILSACDDKLNHLQRSSGKRKKALKVIACHEDRLPIENNREALGDSEAS